MDSVTTQQLQISPELPAEIQKGHKFNEMDRTFVSIPVLCDAECKVVFKKDITQVFKDNKIIIEGQRDSKIWLTLLKYNKNKNKNNDNKKPSQQSFIIQIKYTANSVYQQKLAAHLQAWHHATLEAPVVTTSIQAINKIG